MGRLGVYAALSTTLAAGVVVSAFHQRPNFYSACVYLSQSNLCLMILINLILLIYATLVYGLQRLCYGPLRPIEIEQLYEKGWFAVTETCLAMTIFREEVGAWFLVMFVALLTGKVWGWIGDGRVEILEQQPPANPRLFHIRLSVSLIMSLIYDMWLMRYSIKTVVQQARPNMMVMFLFEFAVLSTSSLATASRYAISLTEARIVKKQTQLRLEERRGEVREERAEILRQREAAQLEGSSATEETPLPSEDDVDEMDIEVQGWEAKGQWVLTLDLITDFFKLLIYITFFVILMVFYGLPIHIIRDLVMTLRSFIKRLTAFLRYRRATQNMNIMYGDATAEDIEREDTCIICREEMRPWTVMNPQVAPGQAAPRANATANERQRPKKLPCGHILHLGCLKSWLERQQACPTCRAPVVTTTAAGAPPANNIGQPPGILAAGQPNAPAAALPRPQMRMFNLGPLRLGFGQGNLRDAAGPAGVGPQVGRNNERQAGPRVYGLELGFPGRARAQAPAQEQATGSTGESRTTAVLQADLHQMEVEISAQINRLQLTQQQLQLVNLLQVELTRLRTLQAAPVDSAATAHHHNPVFAMPQTGPQLHALNRSSTPTPTPISTNVLERHTVRPGTVPIASGSNELPPGVSIPEGWSLLPLHREGVSQFPHSFHSHALDGRSPTRLGQAGLGQQQPVAVAQPIRVPSPFATGLGGSGSSPMPTVPRAAPQPSATVINDNHPVLLDTDAHNRNERGTSSNTSSQNRAGQSSVTPPDAGPVSSSWRWDDDDDEDDDDDVSGDGNRKSDSENKGKLPARQEELAEKSSEDDDDHDEESDEEGEGEDESDALKSKGKAVSVEDVDDEDA